MPVWIRRSLIAVALVLVLLVATAAVLIATFDANKYKGVAIDWVKQRYDRTLVIDGPIGLSVFPRLEVTLQKVQLSEAGQPGTFASFDEAALAVDALPLLRGDLVVGRISAQGVALTYLRDAAGRSNIDDFLRPGPPSEPNASAGEPLRWDVSGIALQDVRARIKDEQGGVEGEVLLQTLQTGRLSEGVESEVSLRAQAQMKQPAVSGALEADLQLKLSLATGSASLRDMSLGFKGNLPGASDVDALLTGSLDWDGARRAVDAQSLRLQLDAVANGLRLEGSTLAVERFSFDAGAKAIELKQLQARLKGQRRTAAGDQPLSLALDWAALAVKGNALSGSPLSGTFSLAGATPLSASFKSAAPTGSFDAIVLRGFEATVTSQSAARNVNATVRSDLTLQPTASRLALDALAVQARLQEPSLQPLAIALRGRADADAQRAQWTLAGDIQGSAFDSTGSATYAGTPPHLQVQARFAALDLNRLLASPPKAEAGPAQPGTGAPAANPPVDLSALRSVNGRFRVQAGQFAYQQYRVADLKLDASLDGGMLRLAELSGRTWGGQVNLTGLADARASRVALKGAANNVNVNALLQDVARNDALEGTGRVDFDVDTAGRSVNEMKSRLKGTVALKLRDGAVKGVNLAKSLRQARAALGLKKDEAQRASETEKTDFSEMNASFQISEGVARNNDLDVKSPFLRIGGDGSIDIGRSTLNYLARATVTATSKGQDGAELAALKGLTVPVRLSGPFAAVDWKIQWSAVAAGALTNEVQDRLGRKLGEKLGVTPADAAASGVTPREAAEDAAKKKLNDKLRGLFK